MIPQDNVPQPGFVITFSLGKFTDEVADKPDNKSLISPPHPSKPHVSAPQPVSLKESS